MKSKVNVTVFGHEKTKLHRYIKIEETSAIVQAKKISTEIETMIGLIYIKIFCLEVWRAAPRQGD